MGAHLLALAKKLLANWRIYCNKKEISSMGIAGGSVPVGLQIW